MKHSLLQNTKRKEVDSIKGNGSSRGQRSQSTSASAPVFSCSASLTCASTPRTVGPLDEKPPQPLDPYGARITAPGGDGHASSPRLTQALEQLNLRGTIRGSQPPHGGMQRSEQSSFQPRAAAAPARPDNSGTSYRLFPVLSLRVLIE